MRFVFFILAFLLSFKVHAAKPVLYTGSDAGWAQMAVGGPTEDYVYTAERVLIDNLQTGDVLDVYAEAQARNDLGYNVEFAQALQARDCVSGSFPPSYNNDLWADLIGPINGWNIVPAAHYGRASKAYVYTVPAGRTCLSIELRLRARSSSTSGGVVNLAIQQSQGLIQVKLWR